MRRIVMIITSVLLVLVAFTIARPPGASAGEAMTCVPGVVHSHVQSSRVIITRAETMRAETRRVGLRVRATVGRWVGGDVVVTVEAEADSCPAGSSHPVSVTVRDRVKDQVKAGVARNVERATSDAAVRAAERIATRAAKHKLRVAAIRIVSSRAVERALAASAAAAS